MDKKRNKMEYYSLSSPVRDKNHLLTHMEVDVDNTLQPSEVIVKTSVNRTSQNEQSLGSYSDYMALSIFAFLCCCMPVGGAAIYRAREARRYLERGEMQNAIIESKKARKLAFVAIALGIVITPLLVYYYISQQHH